MPGVYWDQIKDILSSGVDCMESRTVATDEGVFRVDLEDYETVKRLHKVIAAAIDGWARQPDGQWVKPPRRTKDRAMPPRRPLPVEDVDTFLTWVDDGMPEGPAVA